MKRTLAILTAALMLFALAACSPAGKDNAKDAEKTKFIMGIDPEYPPFSYIGDDGS